MELYVFRGEHKNRSEELLKKAIEVYVSKNSDTNLGLSCSGLDQAKLKRTESGKPYFEEYPLCFSISHTGEFWSCLIASENVGLDIQQKQKSNFEKLANRFFLDEEIKFVRDNGSDGFFDIWVRKEACIKYFGTGIRDLRTFSVVKDGKLAEEISLKGKDVKLATKAALEDSVCFIKAFELAPDVTGAYCCATKGTDLWIRELS